MVSRTVAGLAALALSLALTACTIGARTAPPATSSPPAVMTTDIPTTDATPSTSPTTAARTTRARAGGLRVAVLPKGSNIGFFNAWYTGAKRACDELKATACDYVGTSQATGDAQVQLILTLVKKKYSAIVVSAADADKLAPALRAAQKAGVTVVTDETDVSDPTVRSLMIQPSSADLIGIQQVKWALQLAPAGGEIAVLSSTPTAQVQNTWIGVMTAELTKPEYAKLKLVATAYGDDDPAKCAQAVAGLLQAHPNLKVIISPTTVGIREAAKFVSGSPYKGKVFVTGLGLPSEMKKYSKDGTSPVFGLWNPIDLGYIGVYAAAGVHGKSLHPKEGATFRAGAYTLTVGKNGVVVVGPPFAFTNANIDEFAAIY